MSTRGGKQSKRRLKDRWEGEKERDESEMRDEGDEKEIRDKMRG